MTEPLHTATTVLDLLTERDIEHRVVHHPPLMTVEDSKRLRGDIEAAHIKNLFLRDKKRNFYLVTASEDLQLDLRSMRTVVGASGSLGFASSERLWERLGVAPGAVSPLGLLNDAEGMVRFFLHRRIAESARIAVHPLVNDQTVVMATSDLGHLIAESGHEVAIFDA